LRRANGRTAEIRCPRHMLLDFRRGADRALWRSSPRAKEGVAATSRQTPSNIRPLALLVVPHRLARLGARLGLARRRGTGSTLRKLIVVPPTWCVAPVGADNNRRYKRQNGDLKVLGAVHSLWLSWQEVVSSRCADSSGNLRRFPESLAYWRSGPMSSSTLSRAVYSAGKADRTLGTTVNENARDRAPVGQPLPPGGVVVRPFCIALEAIGTAVIDILQVDHRQV